MVCRWRSALLGMLLQPYRRKRRAAIKDSGGIIPGIGGMFDLSDSLLLTAPIGYLLFRLL